MLGTTAESRAGGTRKQQGWRGTGSLPTRYGQTQGHVAKHTGALRDPINHEHRMSRSASTSQGCQQALTAAGSRPTFPDALRC